MITTNIGSFSTGEVPAPLVYQFQDAAGAPLSLAGYAARFTYRERSDDVVTTASATVTDAANGEVTYVWTGAELTEPGHYLAEFWVGNGANRFDSVTIEYDVCRSVGPAPSI